MYTVRSERLLMEQLDYNLLFRWFVGLNMDERVWDPTTFSKNRERLLAGEIARAFFARILAQAREHQALSDEHFTVDATLIDAWARRRASAARIAPPREAAGRPRESDGELSRRAAEQCDASVDHGSGRPPVSEREGPRSAAVLSGPRADGEPARVGRRYGGHPRHRTCGA